MLTLPWWIYLVLAGIVFCAVMIIKSTKEDKMIDLDYIEQEGEKYIQRMEQERERRRQVQG